MINVQYYIANGFVFEVGANGFVPKLDCELLLSGKGENSIKSGIGFFTRGVGSRGTAGLPVHKYSSNEFLPSSGLLLPLSLGSAS